MPKNRLVRGYKYNIYREIIFIFSKIEVFIYIIISILMLINSQKDKSFNRVFSKPFIVTSTIISSVVYAPINFLDKTIIQFNELLITKDKNQRLEEENKKLKALYIKYLNFYYENKELKAALNFVSNKSQNYKIGHINSVVNDSFGKVYYIDLGRNSNVKLGAMVTGTSAMIGTVIDVGKSKSKVMLVNDSNSRIPVITSKSRTKGILAGNATNKMNILYLSKNHSIKVNDFVFTSSDGNVVLPGILIGVVSKVSKTNVEVIPIENFDNINTIAVTSY